jgi:GMP synthase (glutamine-hydrolysing)
VTDERIECERWCTHQVEQILQSDTAFWRDEVSQPVVGYFGTPTVGQKGDSRVYAGSIVTRAIKTIDYMTAEGLEVPSELRREIKRVVTKHPLVVRALFDETDKPPGTTEFE